MPTWQQEMGWHCDACSNLNLGRFKSCQNCGKPKDREPFIDLPNEGEGLEFAVKDPELLKQALAGSDWECRFCSSHQRRDNGDCANCGSCQGDSRDHVTKWDDGTEGPGGSGLTLSERVREQIEEGRRQHRERYAPAKASVPAPRPPEPVREPMRSRTRRKSTYEPIPMYSWRKSWWSPQKRIAAGIAAAALLLGTIFFLLFRTRIVEAKVTAVQWTYSVHVQRYQIKRDEGFTESQPGDAFDVELVGMRHHHYDRVQDGTREESYTAREACGTRTIPGQCTTTPVRCSSNGNGFKTCSGGGRVCSPSRTETKYCSVTKHRTVPVYKNVSREEMWYRWKVWRWVHNRTISKSGSDFKPFWPTAAEIRLNKHLGPEAKRERTRRETRFVTTFADNEGDVHKYKPKSFQEFQSLPVGTEKRLKVSIAGSPEIVPDQ